MAESRAPDYNTAIIVGSIVVVGGLAYMILHKSPTVDLADVESQSVVYNGGSNDVAAGQKVSAEITVINTGKIAGAIKFRCDLLKTGIASPKEGNWKTFDLKVSPDPQIFTVSSIVIPSDWGNGQTLTARVLLNGIDGNWDISGLLTVGALGNANINFSNSYPVNVEIDFGEWSGTTPFSSNLLAGVHNWVASDNAGNSNSGTFTVKAGQSQSVDVKVVKGAQQKGTLKINFTPVTATVTVDGSTVVSGGSYQLTAGYHTWDAYAPGYYRDNQQFLIVAGQTTTIDYPMVPIPGSATPALSASYSQGAVSCSFSGFHPNDTITIIVTETGGYVTHESDSNGAGSIVFGDNDPLGSYHVFAYDGNGNTASAVFTID